MGGEPITISQEAWQSILGQNPPIEWKTGLHGVHPDSRRIRPGYIFVAIPGQVFDGLSFVADAVKRGAIGIIAERPVHASVPVMVVEDSRSALTKLARAIHGFPDEDLRITAVTGTNGKTSVTGFIQQLLEGLEVKAGLLGTVSYSFGERNIPARRTTPGAPELQDYLRLMLQEGCTDCVMEVSSHALHQKRVEDLHVSTAVFTNLSQDHLDYHHSMEDYFEAKADLFAFPTIKHRIVGEDSWSEQLASRYPDQVIRCGLGESSDVRAQILEMDLKKTEATITTPWGDGRIDLPMPGEHNVRNVLQAIAVLGCYGYDIPILCGLVSTLCPAPGRLEWIPSSYGRVFVDYAHTPDALLQVVNLLRPLTTGALTVVFGCGGDRDRGKRKLMVEAVATGADRMIFTLDNPRKEDPEQIFADMKTGLHGDETIDIIPDRKQAITAAVNKLGGGDVILIAGKGHESVQEIGSQQEPFDDRVVAKKALRERELYESGVC